MIADSVESVSAPGGFDSMLKGATSPAKARQSVSN